MDGDDGNEERLSSGQADMNAPWALFMVRMILFA